MIRSHRPYRWLPLLAIVLSLSPFPRQAAGQDRPDDEPQVLSRDALGTPTFVLGSLGKLDRSQPEKDAVRFAQGFAEQYLHAQGSEKLVSPRLAGGACDKDLHVRLSQQVHGLPVEGARLVIHAREDGTVYAVNGRFMSDDGWPTEATLPPEEAVAEVLRALRLRDPQLLSEAKLTYVLDQLGEGVRLAWKVLVSHEGTLPPRGRGNGHKGKGRNKTQRGETVLETGQEKEYLFADATDGSLAARHPLTHSAKHWKTYQSRYESTLGIWLLPGDLQCQDGQTCPTSFTRQAHENVSDTYDFYSDTFCRDSINGNGVTVVSSIGYGSGYNNAFWNGFQMVLGDGDGVTFGRFGSDLDIVAHEFTHGVTQNESGLIYFMESGALNEALSDIFAAGADAWKNGGVRPATWLLAEGAYTPQAFGDALRYMNDPTQDGRSRDFYPERVTNPNIDNGGVHLNSGIANLAFQLMVQGGTHPQGKTTNLVRAIGMDKAIRIFYRAQTAGYLTPSSTFEDARHATQMAALDLYGSGEADVVHDAWCAVGVPGCGISPRASSFTGDFNGDGQDELLRIVWDLNRVNLYRQTSNSWDCLWSNIQDPGSAMAANLKELVVGDFDGDDEDEILKISANGWMTMFHFTGSGWQWGWSNYGKPNEGAGIFPYRHNLLAGDFDGDGSDEVLGIGGWMTMFHFYGGDWHWGWSNSGNTNVAIYPYRHDLIVGDFDGDSKDEVLGIGQSGWMTMFHFYGGDWHWGWSNSGNPAAGGGIYPYRGLLVAGDYDGDSKDELFGVSSWVTMFHFGNGTWNWGWSNSGSSAAGDGIYSVGLRRPHRIIPGDFDGDGRDELLRVLASSTVFEYEADNDFNRGVSDSGNPFLLVGCN